MIVIVHRTRCRLSWRQPSPIVYDVVELPRLVPLKNHEIQYLALVFYISNRVCTVLGRYGPLPDCDSAATG